jgi:hypothetical protein
MIKRRAFRERARTGALHRRRVCRLDSESELYRGGAGKSKEENDECGMMNDE